jgi:oligosaccharide repeat unit polymerase
VLSMVPVALYVLPAPRCAGRRSILLRLSTGLSALWAIRILLSGDRNAALLVTIVAVAGLFTFRFRAGRWVLAVLCAAALAVYGAVEQLRKGQTSSLREIVRGAPGTLSFGDYDTSFNITTVGVRAALAGVPEHIDFGYGLYKLVGAAGIVPFIRGLLIPPDMAYTSSSDVLNEIIHPTADWSVGTNVIADVYVDFGLLGVPILLFALGLFVAYTQRSVMQVPNSPWRGVVYLTTLALVAEVPRYSLTFPVRPLVWVLILFAVIWLLSPAPDRRGRKPKTVHSVGAVGG